MKDQMIPIIIGILLTALLGWAKHLDTRITYVEKHMLNKANIIRQADEIDRRLERLELKYFVTTLDK